MTGIQFTNANIPNWPGATTMGNGLVSLTLAPEAARILQCSFMGQDLFFVNPTETGQVYPGDMWTEWHNFGGARFDVAPQSAWASTSWSKEWPPPPILNSARIGEVSGNTYIMKTDGIVPNALDVGIKTWIDMIPGSTLIETRTQLTGLGQRRAWANWIVAQLSAEAGNSIVYLPSTGFSKHPHGYQVMMQPADGTSPIAQTSYSTPLAFDYDGTEWKFGFDNRYWIALRPDKSQDTVVVLLSELKAGGNYPDDESSVEYYAAAHMPYVELELLGPLAQIAEGEKLSDTFRIGIARCEGDIVEANKCGVVSAKLSMRDGKLFGRFGSFYRGKLRIVGQKTDGATDEIAIMEISPERSIALSGIAVGVADYENIAALVLDESGSNIGTLDILNI